MPPLGTGKGLGHWSRLAGGESRRTDGGGRQREEGTPEMENTGDDRDLIAQVEDGKGGATGKGKSDTGSRKELIAVPSRGGKRRRVMEAGRRGRHPGGWLLRARARWGDRRGCKEIDMRR